MHTVTLYSALLAAGAGFASAASSTCTTTIRVTQPTPTIPCDVIDGSIVIDEALTGDVVLDGPKQVKGDITVTNATGLISLSSTTINAVGGKLEMGNLELLSSMNFESLKTVNNLDLWKLPQLATLGFGPSGISQASTVTITDTFLGDLNGLNLQTVDTLSVTNNRKLATFVSKLANITTLLTINSNGNGMDINMPDLEMAGEIQLSNVRSFNAPKLSKISGSIKFDGNPQMSTYEAKNLTSVTNSVTFINNNMLANVSFPLLTKAGDLTIQNNTALGAIDGFPQLQTIYGGMILRGNFSSVELPSLKDVKGGVTVSSTGNIESFCSFFDDAKKHGAIQGSEKCTSNNAKANEGGDGGSTGHGGSGNSTSHKNSAVSGPTFTMGFALGLALLAAGTQLL